MDPDAALDELLTIVDRVRTLGGAHLPPRVLAPDVARAVELVDVLDSWLMSGGFLPDRWKPAAKPAD